MTLNWRPGPPLASRATTGFAGGPTSRPRKCWCGECGQPPTRATASWPRSLFNLTVALGTLSLSEAMIRIYSGLVQLPLDSHP